MPSRLLEVPTEIRLKILKELLCGENGYLEFEKQDRKVYPAVLATCRLLHKEGCAIFHSNRIYYVSATSMTSKNLPREFHKIQIDIRLQVCELESGDIGGWANSGYAYALTEEVNILKGAPQYTDFHVDLEVSKSEKEIELYAHRDWNSEVQWILNTFQLMRRLEHVEITGTVTPEFALDLAAQMTGDNPVVDVPAMLEPLQRLLGCIPDEDDDNWYDYVRRGALSNMGEDAVTATRLMSEEDFYTARRKAIKDLYTRYPLNPLAVFDNDPDPDKARFEALFDEGKEILERRVVMAEGKPDSRQDFLADLDQRIEELKHARERVITMPT